MTDANKVCFIVSHKYFRGYESYINYYVGNIKEHYPESLVIVVDNNSNYPEDVLGSLKDLDNVVLLTNNIESKFELGAYRVGLNYIRDTNILSNYSYFVFTQDTFVLKNKYDFNEMRKIQNFAKPINSFYADGECRDIVLSVTNKLGLNDNWDKVNFCWCSSFVVEQSKVEQLHSYLNSIIQTCRWESCAAERYLARILWELNEHRDCGDIDGSASDLAIRHYDTWTVDVYSPTSSIFVKRVQQKTENTVDMEGPQPIVHVTPDQLKDNYKDK